MVVVKFAFVDPTSTGTDSPAGSAVRCALLEREASGGKVRSVRPFSVPIQNGAAQAVLSAGVWRVEVVGVQGLTERYVQVIGTEGTVDFTALADVDPRSIDMTPETRPVWQDLAARVDELQVGGPGGSVSVSPHPSFPGVLVLGGTTEPPSVAPVVTVQPASVWSAWGDVATFTAAASGTPAPTVQWQSSASGSGPWVDIAGATSPSYSTPPLTYAQNGSRYRAVFTNSAGSATSSAASLSVVD